jgi:hypothetical protein
MSDDSNHDAEAALFSFQRKVQALLARAELEPDDPAFLRTRLELALKLLAQVDSEIEIARRQAHRAIQQSHHAMEQANKAQRQTQEAVALAKFFGKLVEDLMQERSEHRTRTLH